MPITADDLRHALLPDNVIGSSNGKPSSPGSADLIKYVLVQLDVARTNHEEFQRRMRKLTELMYQYKKWELVFAAYPITGKVSTFVHIWKIPDESTIVEVMREGALKPTLPSPEAAGDYDKRALIDYDFRSTYQAVQDLVIETTHTLLTSLSYDPENIGHQTQTVLIDANKKPYLIYHRALRGRNLKQLTSALEDVRVRDDVRQQSEGISLKPEPLGSEGSIVAIQQLLNRGITDATLHDGNGKALLFNLAGLRPKTIFEDLQAVTEMDKKKGVAAEAPPDPAELAFPKDVTHLVLAMPDGNVYLADEAEMRKLAKRIPPSKLTKTKLLTELFVDGLIPLASIPNERYEIVGDGCACYVINLSSFGPPER